MVASIHHVLCASATIQGTAARLALAAARSLRSQLIMAVCESTGWLQKASLSHMIKCVRPSLKE